MRTRTPKPSALDVLDVEEENNINQRKTSHHHVRNLSSKRQPLDVPARHHYDRNSLVFSEPAADGTGDNFVNMGEEMPDGEEN